MKQNADSPVSNVWSTLIEIVF